MPSHGETRCVGTLSSMPWAPPNETFASRELKGNLYIKCYLMDFVGGKSELLCEGTIRSSASPFQLMCMRRTRVRIWKSVNSEMGKMRSPPWSSRSETARDPESARTPKLIYVRFGDQVTRVLKSKP
eukprot:6184046-Pleurochrysis_carterae.AAC.4